VGLNHLSASRQVVKPASSLLEAGDELYARNDYTKALAYFQEQARTAGASEEGRGTRREATCKAGLCLVACFVESLGGVGASNYVP
jgi:hypothetical protein